MNVISTEQPIHFEELCRRIVPLFDRQKVTSYVRDAVRGILRYFLDNKISVDEKDFVRLIGFEDVKVRIPDPNDDYIRPITYICDKELALAMKTIASNSYGITQDNLFITTAREFGFKRTGENIINALMPVYLTMLDNGEITEVDGKVQVTDSLT